MPLCLCRLFESISWAEFLEHVHDIDQCFALAYFHQIKTSCLPWHLLRLFSIWTAFAGGVLGNARPDQRVRCAFWTIWFVIIVLFGNKRGRIVVLVMEMHSVVL